MDLNPADVANRQKKKQYNKDAVKLARKLHDYQSSKQQAKRPGSWEDLFGPSNRAGLGVALEYERMGNRPVSAKLQARMDAHGYRLEHLGVTIGTILHGIDLKQSQSSEQVRLVRDLLLERKVIFFRDQHLDEDQQVIFARNFGDLDAFPFGQPGENPYILQLIHGPDSPGTENGWHTDVTWMERPSLGSIAQSVEVPPVGGDTLFSDSHACYLGMPAALQERVRYLHAMHDYRLFLERRGPPLPAELVRELKQTIPYGVSHPIVRTHPETGKLGLYIHSAFIRPDSLFDGLTGQPLDKDESRELVRELAVQHTRMEYNCRFTWQRGSIAFWDNRAVQHYAASDYYPHRRVLRRVTISGDKPY